MTSGVMLRLKAKLAHHEQQANIFLKHAETTKLETEKEAYKRLARIEKDEVTRLRRELEHTCRKQILEAQAEGTSMTKIKVKPITNSLHYVVTDGENILTSCPCCQKSLGLEAAQALRDNIENEKYPGVDSIPKLVAYWNAMSDDKNT